MSDESLWELLQQLLQLVRFIVQKTLLQDVSNFAFFQGYINVEVYICLNYEMTDFRDSIQIKVRIQHSFDARLLILFKIKSNVRFWTVKQLSEVFLITVKFCLELKMWPKNLEKQKPQQEKIILNFLSPETLRDFNTYESNEPGVKIPYANFISRLSVAKESN